MPNTPSIGIIGILPCKRNERLLRASNPGGDIAIFDFANAHWPAQAEHIAHGDQPEVGTATAGLREMFEADFKDQACATAAGFVPFVVRRCIAYSFA